MKRITIGLLLLLSASAFGNTLDDLLQKARQNDPQAQYDVASYYLLRKDEDSANRELALYWFETAAENGNKNAQSFLAQEYQQGLLAKKNPQLAVYWLTVLSLEGENSALLQLAHYFQSNSPSSIDFTDVWLRIAADKSAEGEQEYSAYLQKKFNKRREEQLSDSQQLESAFEQTANHDKNSHFVASDNDGVSSDWLFWLFALIPFSVLLTVVWQRKTINKLKGTINQRNATLNSKKSAQEAELLKQKKQINLLFNELKRSKTSSEQQKLIQACAIFGFTPTSIPDKQKIKVRYKQLSKIYHPDMKGSDEEMKRLNQALKIILNKIQ